MAWSYKGDDMSFWTNIFSGDSYSKIGNTIIDQHGRTFSKAGDGWIANDNGALIQKQGNEWVNLKTGIRSSFDDPFKSEDWE